MGITPTPLADDSDAIFVAGFGKFAVSQSSVPMRVLSDPAVTPPNQSTSSITPSVGNWLVRSEASVESTSDQLS